MDGGVIEVTSPGGGERMEAAAMQHGVSKELALQMISVFSHSLTNLGVVLPHSNVTTPVPNTDVGLLFIF